MKGNLLFWAKYFFELLKKVIYFFEGFFYFLELGPFMCQWGEGNIPCKLHPIVFPVPTIDLTDEKVSTVVEQLKILGVYWKLDLDKVTKKFLLRAKMRLDWRFGSWKKIV